MTAGEIRKLYARSDSEQRTELFGMLQVVVGGSKNFAPPTVNGNRSKRVVSVMLHPAASAEAAPPSLHSFYSPHRNPPIARFRLDRAKSLLGTLRFTSSETVTEVAHPFKADCTLKLLLANERSHARSKQEVTYLYANAQHSSAGTRFRALYDQRAGRSPGTVLKEERTFTKEIDAAVYVALGMKKEEILTASGFCATHWSSLHTDSKRRVFGCVL